MFIFFDRIFEFFVVIRRSKKNDIKLILLVVDKSTLFKSFNALLIWFVFFFNTAYSNKMLSFKGKYLRALV